MINLATFNRRAALPPLWRPSAVRAEQIEHAAPDAQLRDLAQREEQLAERERAVTERENAVATREQKVLEVARALKRNVDASKAAPPDLSNHDISHIPADPAQRAEWQKTQAMLIGEVWAKWERPGPEKSRVEVAKEVLAEFAPRQAALQAKRVEREQASKALADQIIAVGKKHNSPVLIRDE
jgi:hypothetical protein